ncbi:Calcium-dependent lipid-binding (CaLB domain) family protein [Raphanus sativus]|nr:Calcium-dependent lipid-binding (CaLB domain) family protein [Raphanus sativus]
MASSEPLDLVVTVVSAKHLKNVNWRNGELKPYVVLYLDSDHHRVSTHSDDSVKPVWNERITLPLARSVHESVLNVEILHSDAAKTLVGSLAGAPPSLGSDSREDPLEALHQGATVTSSNAASSIAA